jgi:hypothetical protein
LTARRSRALFGGVLLATVIAATLAAQAPATDIFIADLSSEGGRARVGPPRNATRRAGYDNQPAFLPDGRAFLYTSIRADAQADIYRYDPAADSGVRVTTTPESEYSPTPLGDGGFAVVRVEADSTQRLWRFDAAGTRATLVLERVKPVGYFAFGDEHTLGLFVLGQPASFQVADTRSGRADTVVVNIGRTIQRVPGRRAISFVRRASDTTSWITVYDLDTSALTPVVRTPGDVDFYAWTPGGALLAGRGSKLYQWTSGTAWEEIADLAAAGLTSITRLAISPRGDRIAIVAVPSSGDAR